MGTIEYFDIESLRQSFNLGTFIETGTLYGDGVKIALRSVFDSIISIEIDHDLAMKAQDLFKNNPRVTIREGNSPEILKEILPSITNNIFFWLDAHFPGADSHARTLDSEKDSDIRIPLEQELNIISERVGKYQDIIVSDDLWLYENNSYGAGSFNDHCERHGFNVTKEQICGKDLSFLHTLFEKSHEIRKFYAHQGYVLLLPRK